MIGVIFGILKKIHRTKDLYVYRQGTDRTVKTRYRKWY